MAGEAIRILLIEDDYEYCISLKNIFQKVKDPTAQFTVEYEHKLESALTRLTRGAIDVILLDLSLPDSRGLDSFLAIQSRFSQIPIIIVTGTQDDSLALEAVRQGAQEYVVKGQLDRSSLIRTILYGVERHRIKHQVDVLNAQLEKLAFLDPLTNLLNRRGLQHALFREFHLAHRDESELPVLLVDVDNFKQLNDTLGHAAGDTILKEIASRLKSALRAVDYVARIGGDEFMIILPHTRIAEAVRVAEKVRLSVSGTPISPPSGEEIKVTVSLGAAMANDSSVPTVDNLIAATHEALSKSKKSGKNQVTLSGGDERIIAVSENAFSVLRLGEGLRTVKQPIFNLSDRQIIGYEFLTRSSIDGFEMPEDFFRVCSESNILTQVDRQCFKMGVQAASALLPEEERHLNLFPSTVLNMPIEYFLNLFPVDRRPGTYFVEMSEQQIIGDPSTLAKPIRMFKQAGIRVAIDDTGFGRSCLESLIILKPDMAKIGIRHVKGIGSDPTRAQSLKRLLKVANALGAKVVAEGIESEEDLNQLVSLGIKYGQGFLLGKPA